MNLLVLLGGWLNTPTVSTLKGATKRGGRLALSCALAPQSRGRHAPPQLGQHLVCQQ